MKSLFKVLALSFLAAFIALGCSNTSDNAFSNGLPVTSKTVNKTITLVATGDEDAIKFPVANSLVSASIVAGTTKADTLKYYLFYKNEVSGAETAPTEPLAFTASAGSPNIGTVPLTIADGYYTFKLYATKAAVATITEDNVKGAALFLGQTQADLRTSTDTVSFYLTSDTLTGTANVKIGLKTTGWTVPSGYAITAKITKKTDGTTVQGSGGSASGVADVTMDDQNVASGSEQYTQDGVAAGTYNFEVIFKNNTTTKQYVWSDTIIVSPNNDIVKNDVNTIAIPEVIERVPAAPTDFNATFKDPDSVGSGYYQVEFTWLAAASINESHFEIDLLEVPDGATWANVKTVPGANNPATADDASDDWDLSSMSATASNITTYGRDFYGNESQNWIAGSLRKNNNWAIVALPLGKRYLARIAAVNDAGPSRYCYVNFDNANVPSATIPPTGETIAQGFNKFDGTKEKVINRYRLTYNLSGGTVTKKDGSTSTADIVEYRTQNDETNADAGKWDTTGATPVVTPGKYAPSAVTSNKDVPSADIWSPKLDSDADSPYKSLAKGGKEWTSWRFNSSSTTTLYDTDPASDPYNPPDYADAVGSAMGKGYKNLVLYASYSPTTAAVNILDDNLWTVSVENFATTLPTGTGVKAKDGTTALDAAALTADSEITLNLKTSGAGSIVWTGTYTAAQTAAGVDWSSVTYTVKKTDETYYKEGPVACTVTSGTGFTATTNLKSYVPGKYAVTFNAYAPHKTLPYTCTIYVNIIEQ